MLSDRQVIGLKGEGIAARWLEERGWQILDRRFRSGHRDLDLVALHVHPETGERVIAFVEVRTRSSSSFGVPTETVQRKKQREIRKAARAWVDLRGARGATLRFDLIGVLLEDKTPEIEYIPDAF